MAKFELDPDELKKSNEWLEKHLAEKHGGKQPYAGAIGGNFSYIVTYTSLGQIVHIYCSICRSKSNPTERSGDRKMYEECLTNFDDW